MSAGGDHQRSLAERCARLLDARASFARLPLPPELAARDGSFRDEPVALRARAWTGGGGGAGGGRAYARVVTIDGPGLEITNLLGLPGGGGQPILGVDVVALAGAPVVVVADLSPIDGAPPADAPVARAPAAAAAFPPTGPLPAWCARWFSPRHLFTRLDASAAPAAIEAAFAFVAEWVAWDAGRHAPAPDAAATATAAAVAAYCADHLAGDPGLRLLDRMFGAAWSSHFKEAVLFPRAAPSLAKD